MVCREEVEGTPSRRLRHRCRTYHRNEEGRHETSGLNPAWNGVHGVLDPNCWHWPHPVRLLKHRVNIAPHSLHAEFSFRRSCGS